METQEVLGYKRLRLQNIQRNEEYLQQLRFTKSKSKRTLRSNVEKKVDSKKKRSKVNAIIELPTKRSSRVTYCCSPSSRARNSSTPVLRRRPIPESPPWRQN